MSPPKHWRYRCPNGHTCWQRRTSESGSKSRYYCETCRSGGSDPHFEELVDTKTEEAPA